METSIATISLYEPKHDHLKVKTKHRGIKRFVYIVECGPFAWVKPSEDSAIRFLQKQGFRLSEDCTYWEHRYESEDQQKVERNYIKQ